MIRKIALSFLLFTAALSVVSQQRISTYHIEKTEKWSVKIYDGDPLSVREYTLNNGLTVITSKNTAAPRISTMVAVKTGSKNDPSDHTGLAHYLEHMLFKGTDQYGSLDWEKEKLYLDQIDQLYEMYNHNTSETERAKIYHKIDSVSQIAATYAIANEFDKMCQSIGASGTNAFTSNEMTVYVNDVPSNMLHKWVELEAERYRNPVLRLFHTELEAVYEEKNISLDDDGDKVMEKLYGELFKEHNYGKQTTIGTVEHLKNPSLLAIRDYFHKYYVPNNMAVILSGDFDADIAADAVAEHFKYMKASDVGTYVFQNEMPHASPQTYEVVGPDAESVTIGYRLPGANSREIKSAKLVDLLLSNSAAGLIDLNLVKQQKVLSAYSYLDVMNDYSVFVLTGKPKEGQSLEDVRDLLVGQMQMIIDGQFDENMVQAIILNEDISKIRQFKENDSRCYFLMQSYINGMGYMKSYNELWEMQKISKLEIQEIAAEFLNRDRVEVFKRLGEDKNVTKVVKPEIHPVALNRDKQSDFVTKWLAEETQSIKPVFADFNLIEHANIGDVKIDYVKNNDNRLFDITYIYEFGKFHNKAMSLALNYIKLIGSKNKTAEDISKSLYNLGCTFSARTADKRSFITITGPEENFNAAIAIVEDLLQNPIVDETAFAQMIENESKSRSDAKLNNRVVANRLAAYALHGASNPNTWLLNGSELSALKASDLITIIKKLSSVPHTLSYFGQRPITGVTSTISELHKVQKIAAVPSPVEFTLRENAGNEVFTVNYDMVQANIYWVSKGEPYNPSEEPVVSAFNQYFGGDMSSVVFQNIRESKALAYSTYALYATPAYANKNNYVMAFIGTQADKFKDAIKSMNELLSDLPADENVFALSKNSLINRLETERITDDKLMSYYYGLQDLGWKTDINLSLYNAIPSLTLDDIQKFHKQKISNVKYSYAILCNENQIPTKELEKYGKVNRLTLEQIFGY